MFIAKQEKHEKRIKNDTESSTRKKRAMLYY